MAPVSQARRQWLKALAAAAIFPLPVWASAVPTRTLRFALAVHNPSSQASAAQDVWLYAPLQSTNGWALQRLELPGASSPVIGADGQSRMHLPIAALPAGATRMLSGRFVLQAMADAAPASLPNPQRWLRAEPSIEVDAPAIIAAARALQQPTPAATAAAIYAFVMQHIQYAGYVAEDLGALYALQRASGDCSEYAFLAAALARVNGLPARVLGGFVCEGDAILKDVAYHNWAEVWLDGRWCVLDAQKGCPPDAVEQAKQYVGFHIYGSGERNCNAECWRYGATSLTLRMV